MMIFVFTGGRDYEKTEEVRCALRGCARSAVLAGTECVFYVGDCPRGLDAAVRSICFDEGFPVRVFRADWSRYGRSAGPIRNRNMVDLAACYAGVSNAVCVAFTGGRGTASCVAAARAAGLRILSYN